MKNIFANSKNKKEKNKNGFTLIELLAVIIILGVLMIIAIPSVTEYIQNSRKNAYVTTATQYISGARNKVNSGELSMYDIEATYYLPTSCVSLEKGGDSPFGKLKEAYVVVTYDGDGYDYYFTARDASNMGILLTDESLLEVDRVESGINDVNEFIAIEGKEKILMIENCGANTKEYAAASTIPVNGKLESNEEVSPNPTPDVSTGKFTVVSGTGKNVGDIVKIQTEEFYVMPDHESAPAGTVSLLAKNTITLTTNNPVQTTENLECATEDVEKYLNAYSITLTNMGLTNITVVKPSPEGFNCSYIPVDYPDGTRNPGFLCHTESAWFFSRSFHTDIGWIYVVEESPYHMYLPGYYPLNELRNMLDPDALYGAGVRPEVIVSESEINFIN